MSDCDQAVRSRLGLTDISNCAPPAPLEQGRVWRITRRSDCVDALRHHAVRTIDISAELRGLRRRNSAELPNLSTILGGVLFACSPQFHHAGRAYLGQLYATTMASMSHDHIAARARALLKEVPPGVVCDLVPVCNALPIFVMAQSLGVDEATMKWLDTAIRLIMTEWGRGPDKTSLLALEIEADAVVTKLAETVDITSRIGTGTIHDAVALGAGKYGFDQRQIAGLMLFFILAGIETTSSFLANIVILIQQLPGFADLMRQKEISGGRFVDEALRFLGPIRRMGRRRTVEPVEIGGCTIPSGTHLLIEVEAAHHDPLAYPDPWRFAPHRAGPPSLAFGAGGHACLGAASARTIALHFVEALSHFDVAPVENSAPRWGAHPGFRGPHELFSRLAARDRNA